VTVPPETIMKPTQVFLKTWKMRNEGEEAWPEGCHLICISKTNNIIATETKIPVKALLPGQETDISVSMIAPEKPKHYLSYWKMEDPTGKRFGQRIWVSIFVEK